MGHVNNAVYLTYLEQARLHLWRERWQVDPRQSGEGIILARAEVDFRSPAVYGETLEVRLDVAGIGRSSFTYEYEVVEAGARRLVLTARTVLVWYDYAAGRSVPIPDAIRALLEEERRTAP
jgi:acyl-CoA thioester hydrolase